MTAPHTPATNPDNPIADPSANPAHNPALALSLLADGQDWPEPGQPDAPSQRESQQAGLEVALCGTSLDDWAQTHIIGDALRASAKHAKQARKASRPRASHDAFVAALHEQLTSTSTASATFAASTAPATPPATAHPPRPAGLAPAPTQPVALDNRPAANERRWQMVAGVATVAAAGSMAFALISGQQAARELASVRAPAASTLPYSAAVAAAPMAGNTVALLAESRQGVQATTFAQEVLVGGAPAVMIRDARLMERMAQHKQLGGNALQAPSGFLRNATFTSAACGPAWGTTC